MKNNYKNIKIENGTLIFPSNTDVDKYNNYVKEVQDLAKKIDECVKNNQERL